jgi:hypothetical protein
LISKILKFFFLGLAPKRIKTKTGCGGVCPPNSLLGLDGHKRI